MKKARTNELWLAAGITLFMVGIVMLLTLNAAYFCIPPKNIYAYSAFFCSLDVFTQRFITVLSGLFFAALGAIFFVKGWRKQK